MFRLELCGLKTLSMQRETCSDAVYFVDKSTRKAKLNNHHCRRAAYFLVFTLTLVCISSLRLGHSRRKRTRRKSEESETERERAQGYYVPMMLFGNKQMMLDLRKIQT